MQITTLLRTLRRTASLRDAAWATAWAAALLVVEVVGRQSPSEWMDASLLGSLIVLGMVTHGRNSAREITWWSALARGVKRASKAVERAMSLSADLRPDRLPNALPIGMLAWIGTLLVAVYAAALFGGPAALRSLAGIAYVPALAALATMWAATLMSWVIVGGLTGWFVIDLIAVRRENGTPPGPRPVYRGTWILAGPTVGALTSAAVPSPVYAALTLLAALGLLLVLPFLTNYDQVSAVTTRRGEQRRVSLPFAFACSVLPWPLLMVTAAFAMSGVQRADATAAGLGFSARAATAGAACWTTFLLLAAYHVLRDGLTARWQDETREPSRRVALDGDPEAVAEARSQLVAAGFKVRRTDRPERGEVRVVVHPPLDGVDVVSIVERRHRIQQRRLIRRGLRRALKAASRFRYDKGHGYLLMPHVAVMPRLLRNEREEDSASRGIGCSEDVLAPDWVRLIPPTGLHHLREVLLATDVDAIFLEDGISHRNLMRVLGILYEVYDMHDGERRVIDRDFVGLVHVRVILHDVGGQSPFRHSGYREPDYENVARARMLHVFKERGGEEDRVEAPAPGDLVPVLA